MDLKLRGAGLICAGTIGLVSLLICLSGFAPARAETPPPFPDFTAKRVTPPQAGATKRITVQITPSPTPRDTRGLLSGPKLGAQDGASVVTRSQVTAYDWFWEAISPDLAESAPGRLETALIALRNGTRPVAVPRLQTLQGIAAAQGIPILKATIGTEVSPALVLAVIAVESAGQVDAVSSAGAQGLMQLMPATADRFAVRNPFLAEDNIRGGVAYLDWLMKEFDRDPVTVLAAYNAGEGAVRDYQGVPPFAETREYVPRVLAAFASARGLCTTPPQLVSDGCVFAILN